MCDGAETEGDVLNSRGTAHPPRKQSRETPRSQPFKDRSDAGRPMLATPLCGGRRTRKPQKNAYPQARTILPGDARWGGWDSNPRPTDYESAALTG